MLYNYGEVLTMDKNREKKAEKDIFKTVCIAVAAVFAVICAVWSFIGY